MSTANADTLSAVVKPAKGIDESATVVVGYDMVSLMKSSRAKLGSFEDRSWDSSSCARTACPFFRSALSHAAPFFSDVAGRFDAPCIVNPISHPKNNDAPKLLDVGLFRCRNLVAVTTSREVADELSPRSI